MPQIFPPAKFPDSASALDPQKSNNIKLANCKSQPSQPPNKTQTFPLTPIPQKAKIVVANKRRKNVRQSHFAPQPTSRFHRAHFNPPAPLHPSPSSNCAKFPNEATALCHSHSPWRTIPRSQFPQNEATAPHLPQPSVPKPAQTRLFLPKPAIRAPLAKTNPPANLAHPPNIAGQPIRLRITHQPAAFALK